MQGSSEAGRFESLMNAGVGPKAFIESFTGISNAMVAAPPAAAEVMPAAQRFVDGTLPLARRLHGCLLRSACPR